MNRTACPSCGKLADGVTATRDGKAFIYKHGRETHRVAVAELVAPKTKPQRCDGCGLPTVVDGVCLYCEGGA